MKRLEEFLHNLGATKNTRIPSTNPQHKIILFFEKQQKKILQKGVERDFKLQYINNQKEGNKTTNKEGNKMITMMIIPSDDGDTIELSEAMTLSNEESIMTTLSKEYKVDEDTLSDLLDVLDDHTLFIRNN